MRRFYFILACAVTLLVSCQPQGKKVASLQTVKVDTVRSAVEQTALQFPGRVKAAQDINLSFRVSGQILKIYVEDGAFVRKGTLLAALDPADYQVQLEATEAQYKQIKAEAERVMALYKENGTTPNDNDKAVYGLKQITAKYQHHKDQLAYTQLYAPIDGYVQKHLFEMHETVAAGMPVMAMISSGAPEVEINLPAAEYIRRAQFDRYHCTFDIYPGKVYPLRLVSISPKANSNQLYTMRLQLVADKLPLPSPGMNTMVTIYSNEDNHQLLSVPTRSLLQQGEQTRLFVYDAASHQVQSHPVSVIRLLSDGHSLIQADQVKPGDLIIASGVHHIKEGDHVEALPAVSSTNVGGLL